jgi:hypothetical protein
MPIILAIWEAEIWRVMVGGQPRQKVSKINPIQLARHGGTKQSVQICGMLQVGGLWWSKNKKET